MENNDVMFFDGTFLLGGGWSRPDNLLVYQDAVYRRADSRTGHLVQIIWANTNKVGCGMVTHSREGSLISSCTINLF